MIEAMGKCVALFPSLQVLFSADWRAEHLWKVLLALAAGLLTYGLLALVFARSYRLLRRIRREIAADAPRPSGKPATLLALLAALFKHIWTWLRGKDESRRAVILTLLWATGQVLLDHVKSDKRGEKKAEEAVRSGLFDRVRMRVEHELFPPVRPLDFDRLNALRKKSSRSELELDFDERWSTWRSGLSTVTGTMKIVLSTPAEVNDRLDEIDAYFEILRDLKRPADTFICSVRIEHGFIAPLHLLTGLLVEFNEKWGVILRSFSDDLSKFTAFQFESIVAGPAQAAKERDALEIQTFIYTCWLLWGPSRPLCNCANATGEFQAVQYGFGDENNSIEVEGETGLINGKMKKLRQYAVQAARGYSVETPMALPATVTGVLKSGKPEENSLTHGVSPRSVDQSRKQERRPVLWVTSLEKREGQRGAVVDNHGKIEYEPAPLNSRYYSAYLWIGFVILKKSGSTYVPRSELAGATSGQWTDFIPFFEHGNLADPESLNFSKKQLAVKVAMALEELVPVLQKSGARLVFACSIDEPGCESGLAFPDWKTGDSVRELVLERVRREAASGNEALAALLADQLVILDPREIGKDHSKELASAAVAALRYSACSLPDLVQRHSAAMYAEEERTAGESAD